MENRPFARYCKHDELLVGSTRRSGFRELCQRDLAPESEELIDLWTPVPGCRADRNEVTARQKSGELMDGMRFR